MTITLLPPLYAIPSAPKELSYTTPHSKKPKRSTLLRPWLSPLESFASVMQIRLDAQRPGTRARDTTYLDLHELDQTIETVLDILSRPIPHDQRRLYQVSLHVIPRDEQLTCRCRIRPKTLTPDRITLLHSLDFSSSRGIATKILLTFWSRQQQWLSESGIRHLELRCDAGAVNLISRTSDAA